MHQIQGIRKGRISFTIISTPKNIIQCKDCTKFDTDGTGKQTCFDNHHTVAMSHSQCLDKKKQKQDIVLAEIKPSMNILGQIKIFSVLILYIGSHFQSITVIH